nr:hypothetical protein REQ54_02657 [Rhizobium sp. Q54]
MAYEWDEKRARRAYWRRIGFAAAILAAAVGASAWAAAKLGLGL